MGSFVNLLYLVAAGLMAFGIKRLSHPRTAVQGNQYAAVGMLIAIVATLLRLDVSPLPILIGIGVGGAIGAYLAIKTEMTSMPELVALFNGFGGIASAVVAGAAMGEVSTVEQQTIVTYTASTVLSGIIGSVTFTGSIVAYGKLQGKIKDDFGVGQPQLVNLILIFGAGLMGLIMMAIPTFPLGFIFYVLVMVFAGLLGVSLVAPIGGADMPVVIALLNSYSGLAASATGFVLGNNILIIAGALVGASGLILTNIMCKAMNRSLMNVMAGGLGEGSSSIASQDDVYEGKITSTSPDEVAMVLEGAQRVVIVPGYGMAVAQAQHAVRDLTNILEERGASVDFGIHPVAGRMPGHMNVLLAESDIPYDKLIEMDDINPSLAQTDVAIVIGANDVVNPSARNEPNSPIAGMPILDVDKARTVVVIKRSLSPGYAGIPNPLFAQDNTLMLFSDGKKALLDIMTALKEG